METTINLVRIEYKDGKMEAKPWQDRDANGFPNHRDGNVVSESEHAKVYHYDVIHKGQGDSGLQQRKCTYVICETGHVNEGKKLLLQYVLNQHYEEIEKRKSEAEKAKSMLETIANEEQQESMKKLVRVDITWEANKGFELVFNEVNASEKKNYEKMVVVQGDGFLQNTFFGSCWKEDVDKCKETILDKAIEWYQRRANVYNEAMNEAKRKMEDTYCLIDKWQCEVGKIRDEAAKKGGKK